MKRYLTRGFSNSRQTRENERMSNQVVLSHRHSPVLSAFPGASVGPIILLTCGFKAERTRWVVVRLALSWLDI